MPFSKSFGNYLVIFSVIVIGFILYANTFPNQLFWDDDNFILKNQYIKDWRYLGKYFSQNVIAGSGFLSNYWRPLLLLVFSLEWHLWENWPPGYHSVNSAFHLADALLLFFILLYIFKNRLLAFLTALVFLAHPLQTEAVAYVNSLGDSLSVFFIFLGILFYLKFRRSGKTILRSGPCFLSLLMYILALMAKETAIVMPAFIFIADFFSLNSKLNFKEKLKKVWETIWPFFVLVGIYILLRATVLNLQNTFNLWNEENIFTSNFYVRLFTFFRVLAIYFGLLFWPVNLHMERTVEIATSLFSPSVIFGGLLFFGLLILALVKFQKWPVFSFGIFWFFIGLFPTSNLIIPINALLYEHWLYLPLIGIFLIVIWLGMLIAKKYKLQKILSGIFIVFLIFLSVLTIKRNSDWRDSITFYNQTLKYAPNSYRVINNLGMAYADKGLNQEAEETYKKAIALNPFNPVAYHNLGNLYRAMNQKELAIESFQTAIKLDPNFFFSRNALIELYAEQYQGR